MPGGSHTGASEQQSACSLLVFRVHAWNYLPNHDMTRRNTGIDGSLRME